METSTVCKVIHIRGMFCEHCAARIHKALMQLPGVLQADVSYEKETATITMNPALVKDRQIQQSIQEAGYEVVSSRDSHVQIISILAILTALYLIAQHLELTQVFRLFPRVDSTFGYGTLFVTGLLTSVHCIAMCGGINLTQSTLSASAKQRLFRSNGLYHLGRVLSYTVVGAVAGSIGRVLTPSGIFKGIFTIVAGLVMLLMALHMLGLFRTLRIHPSGQLHASLFKKLPRGSSLWIGLLNGLMPCGPLQAMQLYALSTGSMWKGALSMLLFCLGTIPLMLLFGLLSGKLNRKYSSIMLTVSALLIFLMALSMIGNGLSLSGVALPQQTEAQVIRAMQDGDRQTLYTEIDDGHYPAVSVKAGIPVDWTIVVPEGKLNGCNGEILIPDFNVDLVLQLGENHLQFTPTLPGTYAYSCWMGMIRSSIEVTE